MTSMLWRQRWYVAAGVVTAMAMVAIPAYRQPKTWESTATVVLDPFPVPGLHADAGDGGDRREAMAAEMSVAQGATMQAGVREGATFPFTYRVSGDPATATLRFTARADSAERASVAAFSVVNGFLAWGRASDAQARVAVLQADLAAGSAPAGAAADLAATQRAIERLAAGAGTVTGPPFAADDPVSPDLAGRLVVAAGLGALVGFAVGSVLGRRRSPSVDRAEDDDERAPAGATPVLAEPDGAAPRRAGTVALRLLLVALPLLPLASAIAAIVTVWELRPTTGALDETRLRCLEQWSSLVPDGASVSFSPDTEAYLRDHLQEFAYPRLTIDPHDPDYLLSALPGPGPEACGGYHLEVERR